MYAIDVHAHFGGYDAGAGSGALVNLLFGGGIDVVRRRAQADKRAILFRNVVRLLNKPSKHFV